MHAGSHLDFEAPGLAAALAALPDDGLDALPFGVVEMDLDGIVQRYNATESRYSGLPRERVLGRHFFRDVAPCSNNRHVAQRYAEATLDTLLDYTFALRMKPVPVTLRLLKPAGARCMHLLVRWS
jgi:photoactive yellow protein